VIVALNSSKLFTGSLNVESLGAVLMTQRCGIRDMDNSLTWKLSPGGIWTFDRGFDETPQVGFVIGKL